MAEGSIRFDWFSRMLCLWVVVFASVRAVSIAFQNGFLLSTINHWRNLFYTTAAAHTLQKKMFRQNAKTVQTTNETSNNGFFCSWGQNIVCCCCQLVTHIDSEHFKLSSAVFTSFARVIWARKCIECASSDPWTSEIITAFYRMANELSSRLCGDPEQMSIQSPKTVLHK